MIRVLAVIFAVIAAIASGWLGYRLSLARSTAATAGPTSEQVLAVQARDSATADQALARLRSASFADVGGHPQSVQQWSGKVLVVNFWATWCPPCREEMPGFSRLQRKLSAKGVQFVGIGVDDADKIRQFVKDFPVAYPLWVADLDTMDLTRDLGNNTEGLPFTLLIDRTGQVRMAHAGYMDEADIERRLHELL